MPATLCKVANYSEGLKKKTMEGSSKHKVKKDNIEMAIKNHHNIESKKNDAMIEK
jgi:hypothetical protein